MPRKLTLSYKEFNELRNSPGVTVAMRRILDAIAADAGPGMRATVQPGRTRAHGSVVTATTEAMVAEARNRSLTRAFVSRRR